jgi:ABC-type polysaccharide/polyol phosphate export permease
VVVSVRSAAPAWSYSGLIWNFALRDIKSRFKGTLLGWAWSIIVPVATVVIYSVVFSAIFRAQPPPLADGRPGNYAVWLLTGLVVWTGFANTLTSGVGTLLGSGSLLQKIYFPSYAPVIGSVISSMMQTGIEMAILLVILLAIGNAGLPWLVLLLWAPIFVAFVASVTYILGAYNVYFRDLAYLITVALQLFFFLTPIIYPISLVPESWHGIPVRALIEANPLAQFVESFRTIAYSVSVPGAGTWAILLGWTAAAFGLSVVTYVRRGLDIGEQI